MPELPEVEVTRRALAPHVEGKVVRGVELRDARLRWPVPRRLASLLVGQRIECIDRRGKYLLWRFVTGTLISHLGMSGSWRGHLDDPPPPGPHDLADLIVVDIANGRTSADRRRVVRLTDPRRFGALLWHPRRAGDVLRHPLLARLGLEPFDPRFEGSHLYRMTRARRGSIKQVLLSGEIVVGVGNIYASESLFRAGVDPRLPAYRLSRPRCDRLVVAVRAVLAEAIELGGSTLRNFIGADGAAGYFMVKAFVYDRAGEPCRVCATPVKRIVQGQRATYLCRRCQRR